VGRALLTRNAKKLKVQRLELKAEKSKLIDPF